MTFKVEDGTGLPDSNSYASVEFADSYFLDRGIADWAALSQDDKQAALIAATDYIDGRFGPYFKGSILVEDPLQALQFPRDAFDGVPINVQKATAEYAKRAAVAALAPDLDVDSSGYQISQRTEKVGPIQESVTFATAGSGSMRQYFKPYPAADMLLRSFVRTSNGSVIRN